LKNTQSPLKSFLKKAICGFALLALACGMYACKKTILNIAGWAFVSADDFLEDRPIGVSCQGAQNEATFSADGFLSFDVNHMLCVQFELNEQEFEVMRYESTFGPSVKHRNGATVLGVFFEYLGQCDVPWPNEFNWYQGNIKIDDIELNHIGMRKKGFLGSIFSPAPSIKVATDFYDFGKTFGKTRSITLNNNSEDATRLRSSLNFALFQMAKYPAPRCNLANVTVNGESFGAYSHLESVDEDFLLKNFGNNEGDLYEGQLADFEQDWLPRWAPKTEASDKLRIPILDLCDALDAKDEKLLAELGLVLNIDQFITFWALEFILEHIDGYSAGRNNFFVYFNPEDHNRACFIPWGMNYFEVPANDNTDTTSINSFVRAEIPRRLSRNAETRLKFENEVNRLMRDVWNEEILIELTTNLALLVKSAENNDEYDAKVTELQNWILNRRSEVELLLKNGLPEGDKRAPLKCFL